MLFKTHSCYKHVKHPLTETMCSLGEKKVPYLIVKQFCFYIYRSFKPDFLLVRQHVRDAHEDWRNLLLGFQYGGVPSVNALHSQYQFLDKPWVVRNAGWRLPLCSKDDLSCQLADGVSSFVIVLVGMSGHATSVCLRFYRLFDERVTFCPPVFTNSGISVKSLHEKHWFE